MTYTPTDFIESNALLSAQIGDDASVNMWLSRLTDHEMVELRHAAIKLASMCAEWRGAGVDLTD